MCAEIPLPITVGNPALRQWTSELYVYIITYVAQIEYIVDEFETMEYVSYQYLAIELIVLQSLTV